MIKLSLFLGLLMASHSPSPALVSQTPQQMQISAASSATTMMTADETRYLELTNAERVARGLNALKYDPTLTQIARLHSKEMSDKSYFSHYSKTPGLETPMDRYLSYIGKQPTWALVGENLFYCSIVDVDRGHEAFMNSPTHRANVLEKRYEKMGIGIYVNSHGEFYVTEMFLSQQD